MEQRSYEPLETLALAAAIMEKVTSTSSNSDQEEIQGGLKPKRKRASPHQLAVLKQHFSKDPFPTTSTRQGLASKLNMTPRSVQIWFQNERQHTKAKTAVLMRKSYDIVTFAPGPVNKN